jgi:hypothetical protein
MLSAITAYKDPVTLLLAIAAFVVSLVTLRRTKATAKAALTVSLATEKQSALGLLTDGDAAFIAVIGDLFAIEARATAKGRPDIVTEAVRYREQVTDRRQGLAGLREQVGQIDLSEATPEKISTIKADVIPSIKKQADKDMIKNTFGAFIGYAKEQLP